jgi:hypothetical protein
MNFAKYRINYCKTKIIDLDDFMKNGNTITSFECTTMPPIESSSADTRKLGADDPAADKSVLLYNPFKIENLQKYNPVYSLFFELSETNYNAISLNHPRHISGYNEILDLATGERTKKDVFVKFAPLLDPIRFMIGKYDLTDPRLYSLPSISSTSADCYPKYLTHTNASYTDNFFCFLSSVLLNEHGMTHGIDYYGSFVGIQERYKMNVEDDLEYLSNSKFFTANVGKLFYIEKYENRYNYSMFHCSRANKEPLQISESGDNAHVDLGEICVVGGDEMRVVKEGGEKCGSANADSNMLLSPEGPPPNQDDIEIVYENAPAVVENTALSGSSGNSTPSDTSSEGGDDDADEDAGSDQDGEGEDAGSDQDGEEDEGEDQEDDDIIVGYINKFPVQMICLEKCDGTLDELFEMDLVDEKLGASALFQIVMTLLIYQRAYHFTHNDLHTNNIMYIKTDQEFLNYHYNGTYYRVPTFGRIYKIIDFGRSIYRFQGKHFCSDSFAAGGDAATQYNTDPFFNPKKPRLEPNYSFDLCRLGCSIYDFVIGDDDSSAKLDEFQKTIARWCTDDSGKNVLYKKNGEERYLNFKLYKMIARNVHSHTPEAQLKFKIFSQYATKKATIDTSNMINIDDIPVYV